MIRANKTKKSKKINRVKIAIIDSGIDWGNGIELTESISFVPGEEGMNPFFMDGSGHGNSVAGLIAAEDDERGIKGINPNAIIYSVRVLDDDNTAPVSRVIQGIYYSIEKGVDIINMSFGMSGYSEALEQAIDDAEKAGILVVAAAGNTGGKVEYPAALSNVISVGSVDSNAELAETSARGKKVDIVAPGELVCSTGEFGDIVISSGTSLAAPQVTAAASLILEKYPDATNEMIKLALIESANYNNEGNYGILDAECALKSYESIQMQYKAGKRIEVENESEVRTYEETGCLTGSWTPGSHAYLVGSGHSNVKKGARYPDEASRFATITSNPGWHGSYHVNYVAAYIYATKMAEQLGKGNSASNAATVSGLSSSEKANMLGDVNSLNWNSLDLTAVTKGTKRAFVWGMAMHTAADVFAHSAFVFSGGAWCHLAHGNEDDNDYADNTGKYPQRFQAAENVISKMVARYDAKTGAGTYAQFTAMSSVAKTFRLKELCPYIKQVNSSANTSSLEDFTISNVEYNYHWAG